MVDGTLSSPSFRLDCNGFLDHLVGPRGLSPQQLASLEPQLQLILKDLAARRRAGDLPFYDLPTDHALIAEVREVAATVVADHDVLLVLGIGGSALGTKAVLEGVVPDGPKGRGDAIAVEVVDNIDPARMKALLDRLDPRRTAVNVISKSGGTAETWAQFLILKQWLSAAGAWQPHVVVTTDAKQGPLRAMADAEGLRSLAVPDGVGGRFSVLTAVGLLPLAAAGVNIEELCRGAAEMVERLDTVDVRDNPAALHAALLWLASTERGASIHVLMPYSRGLVRTGDWYVQLWAESLGKRLSLDGRDVFVGQTPICAEGATDQHSQVQLYVEGPFDKVVTFIRVEDHGARLEIPRDFSDVESVGYLGGHDLGALLNMEQRATELALVEASRLTSVITLDRLDEAALGRLFLFFEVQTLVMGALWNIDALDQPGVEAGKRLTSAMAGRVGYEDDARRVQSMLARKREDWIVA